MKKTNIFVIGGGASGILAAIVAKRNGAEVTVIERNSRIGKKILVTGNGRCNYTNALSSVSDYNNQEFVEYGLKAFSPENTMSFFNDLGIVPKVENEGKAYPLSEQASSIIDVFLYELNRLHIEVVSDAYVINIIKRNQNFQIFLKDGRSFDCDKVILATGGKALATTGSDGSGYELAKKLGHKIVEPFPALVKLKLESPHLKHLQGIKMPAIVELIHNNEVLQKEEGDILFGNYGISGPTILQISRLANELYIKGEQVYIKIILVSSMTKQEVYNRFFMSKDKPVDFSLVGMINKRYISAIIKEAKIEKQNTLVRDLTDKQLNKLVSLLFDWRFLVTGTKGFSDAQVTAGGISVSEINSETMESKKVPGFYITGEVMDIDGRCGGYNLQWAWSSGYLAGMNASN
ncbi:MAG: NAD(P)/FAD-dependent oxidoreductase [Tenericutes bacterium]|nr:NAD(P)/FAD-dependent oxidoreductase [Mycoplasmatota bacterium]